MCQLNSRPFFNSICDNGMSTINVLNFPSHCLLRNPNLHYLPRELSKLKQLIDLQIDSQFFTQQKDVFKAISNADKKENETEAILMALKHRLHKSVPYRGMKMIVIGPAVSACMYLTKENICTILDSFSVLKATVSFLRDWSGLPCLVQLLTWLMSEYPNSGNKWW